MEEGYKANCFSNFNPVTTSFSFLSGTYIYENIIDSKVENPKLSPRMAIRTVAKFTENTQSLGLDEGSSGYFRSIGKHPLTKLLVNSSR